MRGTQHLHPRVAQKSVKLIQLARDRLGLNVITTDTLRSAAEQAAYYAQGRNSLAEVNRMRGLVGMAPIGEAANRSTITKASTAAASWHGYGLAFDIAIVGPDGKTIVWSAKSDWNGDGKDDWASVGQLADEVGLEWGGNFTSIYDAPHYQDRMGFTIASIQAAGAKPGATYRGTARA
jgi:peptidoglycan L-alanyl-D-glutamate endopeptidase CwlK